MNIQAKQTAKAKQILVRLGSPEGPDSQAGRSGSGDGKAGISPRLDGGAGMRARGTKLSFPAGGNGWVVLTVKVCLILAYDMSHVHNIYY